MTGIGIFSARHIKNKQSESQRVPGMQIFLIFLVLLAFSNQAIAGLSQREYVLKGDLTYTYSREGVVKYVEKRGCEILRNGDALKISTWVIGTNYPMSFFISDADIAFTLVQFQKEFKDVPVGCKNIATAFVSDYRMPQYVQGHLTPLWLMTRGHEELKNQRKVPWITVIGGGKSIAFDDQSQVKPTVKSEPYWPDGFSSYLETVEYPESQKHNQITVSAPKTIFQEFSFHILTWTKDLKGQFPQLIESKLKRSAKGQNGQLETISEETITFSTTIVQSLEGPFDTAPPPRTEVSDMRPKERQISADGYFYFSTNGAIFEDPIKGGNKHHFKLIRNTGDFPTKRINKLGPIVVLMIFILAVIISAFFWVKKRWFKN